ncbi:hypothetical protein WA538_005623 [Blastocystis sp. DL]
MSLCVAVPIFAIRKKKWVSSATSRKFLHILMAPIFILCWHLFPSNNNGKYMAALIPGAFTIVFWAVGKGWIRLPMVADSMSRSGSVEELAVGPVHYGICITLGTLFFWKRIEALYCILPISFGDGFAAFFGPHVHGNRPLGWNPSKTWFGFIAFVACSFIGLVVYIAGFEKSFFSYYGL